MGVPEGTADRGAEALRTPMRDLGRRCAVRDRFGGVRGGQLDIKSHRAFSWLMNGRGDRAARACDGEKGAKTDKDGRQRRGKDLLIPGGSHWA